MKGWLEIIKRRKLSALLVSAIIFILGLAATLLIPPSYRSTATVLVQQEELSQEVTGTTQSAYADRRIQILSKRVLSSDNLNRIAKEFNLFDEDAYLDDRLSSPVLNDLRKRIDIEMVSAEVIDSKMRFQVQAAIAFKVSFIADEPAVAQQVTERLVQMFFDENNASLAKTNEATADLLAQEEEQRQKDVESAEEKLRLFKEANVYSLPDMKSVNIQGLEKVADQISNTRLQLKALQERRIYLESELVRLSPNSIVYDADGGRVLGHEDRLKILRAEYAAKRAKYSASHPDLVNLQREIGSLEGDIGSDAGNALEAQLKELRAERAAAESRYTDSHPTLASLDRRIASLESEVRKERSRAIPSSVKNLKADNPAYITAVSNLKSAELEIATLNATLVKLDDEYKAYESRLEQSPTVEREYQQLDREYNQALEEHQTIRKKRFAAQLAGSIEKTSNIAGLKILEAADFPETPYKPNRKLLGLATLLLSLWGGIGTALLREHFDDRIWTPKDLQSELSELPLSVIPTMSESVPEELPVTPLRKAGAA